MIDPISLPIVLMTVGFMIMVFSVIIDNFRFAIMVVIVGGVMFLSGVFLLPNPSLDFCEDSDGVYSQADGMGLCSIPDENGEYVVYKVIKVDDEFKLARFSELSRMGDF